MSDSGILVGDNIRIIYDPAKVNTDDIEKAYIAAMLAIDGVELVRYEGKDYENKTNGGNPVSRKP